MRGTPATAFTGFKRCVREGRIGVPGSSPPAEGKPIPSTIQDALETYRGHNLENEPLLGFAGAGDRPSNNGSDRKDWRTRT